VVVADPLRAGPVVVVDAAVGVVVVALAFGAVVLVVAVAAVVVVVEIDAPVVEVVDVVVGVVVGVAGGAGDWLPRLPSVVPVSAPPNIVDRGLPEISSIAVMNNSARTKTIATVPAMARQEKPCGVARRAGACRTAAVAASTRCVAGPAASAEISRRFVSADEAADDAISTVSAPPSPPFGNDCPTTSVGAEDASASTEDSDGPLVPVPPSRRSKLELSGARIATCLTTSWPLSIDWATKAVPMVAAAEPMATPMIVPFTPKTDKITAATTAPPVEARIWRIENFTHGVSSRPREVRRRER
jgi:hypothetical protein